MAGADCCGLPTRGKRWEETLLGKAHDCVVPQKTGRTLDAVQYHRRQLGIISLTNVRLWTKQDMALLGTMPDSRAHAVTYSFQIEVAKIAHEAGRL